MTRPSPVRRLGRYPALDGLRGIAVLMVLANHAGVFAWGWAGVDVFFVLSGFLITALLCDRWDERGAISLGWFYQRRARRLLPALVLLLAGYSTARVWLGLFPSAWSLRHQLLGSAAFDGNWIMAVGHGQLGVLTPTWSLAQEEQFYLLWPLALWVLLRMRPRPWLMVAVTAGLALFLMAWVPGTAVGRLIALAYNGYYSPFDRGAELLIGCAAALAWRHGLLPRTLLHPLAGWVAVALPAAAYAEWGGILTLREKLLCASMATALLIPALTAGRQSLLVRAFSPRPLRFTGRISYGLYLYQLPLAVLIGQAVPGIPVYARALVLTACAYCVAAASWYLVESRFLSAAAATPSPGVPASCHPPTAWPLAGPVRQDVRAIPASLSARFLLGRAQRLALGAAASGVVLIAALRLLDGLGPAPLEWLRLSLVAVVVLNVVNACWQTLLALAGCRSRVLRPDPGAVPDDELPAYTVLVPLYKEHRVAASLIACLSRLSYPPDRLQILLLVERDDDLTLGALAAVPLDARFETLVFDPSLPRTKPKACNVGLRRAAGKLCVIYDAEDRPEPDQLRKAATAFGQLPPEVVCVQAELHFWNPSTNWLTESFTAEYARRYRLELHGMDRLGLPIPLGGSSNHFRTEALCDLGGWDPHNVTEDADLGIRLARRGWKTRIMDSVTEEEANSDLGNWMRQRSRWIKGHLQTWLVHNRNPVRTWRDLGTRGFLAFQLTLGASQLMLLANPLLWTVTAALIVAAPHRPWELFPSAERTAALGCLAAGYLASAGSLAAACLARGVHRLIPGVLTVPAYWVLMSLAAMKALFQLLHPRRRHYWELTRHGLVPAAVPAPDPEPGPVPVIS